MRQTNAYTIAGRKPENEDSFLIVEKNDALLVLVADGVGGHRAGDYASQATVALFKERFLNSPLPENPLHFLRQTAREASLALLVKGMENPQYKNCGTTLTGFYLYKNQLFKLNVGDSRTYSYHENKLTRLTKDHSVVQELLDLAYLSEDEAFEHPKRNIITSAIGLPISELKIETPPPIEILPHTILLACTDGIHDALRDAEIARLIQQTTFENLSQTLVDSAYKAGSMDNITAVCLSF